MPRIPFGLALPALLVTLLLTALIVLFGTAPAGAQDPLAFTLENGTDRPGGDYSSFATPGDWQACQSACEGDGQCLAWTWVRPGVQGPSAMCWLKNVVPRPGPGDCCISGIRLVAAPIPRPYEIGVDRPGSDYASFDLPGNATAYTCARACAVEGRCAAWTFVMPNIQGPYPRCWLKDAAPPPIASNCCTSGLR